jgi:hypothetical protein
MDYKRLCSKLTYDQQKKLISELIAMKYPGISYEIIDETYYKFMIDWSFISKYPEAKAIIEKIDYNTLPNCM